MFSGLGIDDHLEDEFPQESVCVLPGIPFYHRTSEVVCIKCLVSDTFSVAKYYVFNVCNAFILCINIFKIQNF